MWNFLSTQEAEFTEQAMTELNSVSWTRPLLHRLAQQGGMKTANMSWMFDPGCTCIAPSRAERGLRVRRRRRRSVCGVSRPRNT